MPTEASENGKYKCPSNDRDLKIAPIDTHISDHLLLPTAANKVATANKHANSSDGNGKEKSWNNKFGTVKSLVSFFSKSSDTHKSDNTKQKPSG